MEDKSIKRPQYKQHEPSDPGAYYMLPLTYACTPVSHQIAPSIKGTLGAATQ